MHVLRLQDLNNTDLNKTPAGFWRGEAYRAPGGPVNSPPLYRQHKESPSPRVHSPSSPLNQRAQSSLSVTLSPSYVITSSPSAGGTMSPPAGGFSHFLDPEVLVNKSPSQLPHGVDPIQKEVGSIMDLAQILTDSPTQFGCQ